MHPQAECKEHCRNCARLLDISAFPRHRGTRSTLCTHCLQEAYQIAARETPGPFRTKPQRVSLKTRLGVKTAVPQKHETQLDLFS